MTAPRPLVVSPHCDDAVLSCGGPAPTQASRAAVVTRSSRASPPRYTAGSRTGIVAAASSQARTSWRRAAPEDARALSRPSRPSRTGSSSSTSSTARDRPCRRSSTRSTPPSTACDRAPSVLSAMWASSTPITCSPTRPRSRAARTPRRRRVARVREAPYRRQPALVAERVATLCVQPATALTECVANDRPASDVKRRALAVLCVADAGTLDAGQRRRRRGPSTGTLLARRRGAARLTAAGQRHACRVRSTLSLHLVDGVVDLLARFLCRAVVGSRSRSCARRRWSAEIESMIALMCTSALRLLTSSGVGSVGRFKRCAPFAAAAPRSGPRGDTVGAVSRPIPGATRSNAIPANDRRTGPIDQRRAHRGDTGRGRKRSDGHLELEPSASRGEARVPASNSSATPGPSSSSAATRPANRLKKATSSQTAGTAAAIRHVGPSEGEPGPGRQAGDQRVSLSPHDRTVIASYSPSAPGGAASGVTKHRSYQVRDHAPARRCSVGGSEALSFLHGSRLGSSQLSAGRRLSWHAARLVARRGADERLPGGTRHAPDHDDGSGRRKSRPGEQDRRDESPRIVRRSPAATTTSPTTTSKTSTTRRDLEEEGGRGRHVEPAAGRPSRREMRGRPALSMPAARVSAGSPAPASGWPPRWARCPRAARPARGARPQPPPATPSGCPPRPGPDSTVLRPRLDAYLLRVDATITSPAPRAPRSRGLVALGERGRRGEQERHHRQKAPHAVALSAAGVRDGLPREQPQHARSRPARRSPRTRRASRRAAIVRPSSNADSTAGWM